MLGISAATNAEANSVQAGQCWFAATIMKAKAMTESTVVGTATRVWPSRSI